MTDGQREAGLELFEVARAREQLRAEARARRERGEVFGRRSQILAARERATEMPIGELAAVETTAAQCVMSDDPTAALRHVRLGVMAALALALCLWWLRQRRNG